MPQRKKITTLTDAQWADLARFHEEWYQIGSATGPADRPQAQQTITAMYHARHQPAPYR